MKNRNSNRNWEITPQLTGAVVKQPVIFIAGQTDIVIAGQTAVGIAAHEIDRADELGLRQQFIDQRTDGDLVRDRDPETDNVLKGANTGDGLCEIGRPDMERRNRNVVPHVAQGAGQHDAAADMRHRVGKDEHDSGFAADLHGAVIHQGNNQRGTRSRLCGLP